MGGADTRSDARLLIDAYSESLVGVFALRLPGVADTVRTLAPKMTVESSYDGEHVNLHAAEIVSDVALSGPTIRATIDQISRAFAASMWELLKSHAHFVEIEAEPDIQFFRHVRNACGHDGRWNFPELKRPAVWRDKQLTLAEIGAPVFGGLLKHGDLMLLMIDIDRKYFQ